MAEILTQIYIELSVLYVQKSLKEERQVRNLVFVYIILGLFSHCCSLPILMIVSVPMDPITDIV